VVDVGPYTVRLDPDAREVVVSLGGEEWRAEIVGGPPGLIESSGTARSGGLRSSAGLQG